MENIIYILLPVAYFLYQGYQNYLKEQQKANKRNVSMPAKPEEHIPDEVKTKPIIVKDTEAVELKPDYKLDKQEKMEKQYREELVYEKMKAPSVRETDYYNPEIPSAEVMRSRMIHEKHKHGFSLPAIPEPQPVEFDLRDAIIKQAILNRPYQ